MRSIYRVSFGLLKRSLCNRLVLCGFLWVSVISPIVQAADFFQPVTPPRPVQVMVHRGLKCAAPENTIPAFQAAVEAGFEWIEVDIRLTRDGYYVLMHDSSVDRTTDGSGAVAEMDLAAIQKLDAGSWFSPRFAKTRVPTFTETLDFCKGKINLYLDCKGKQDPAKLVDVIQKAGMERQVVVFDNPDTLEKIRDPF